MYELYANSTGGGESSGNEKKAKRNGGSGDDSASKIAYHRQMAQEFSDSILDLCWDPEKVSWKPIRRRKSAYRGPACSHGSTTLT